MAHKVKAKPPKNTQAAAASAAEPYRPPYGGAAVAAIAVFALYAVTLAPTTQFWDTSEYIATAHILGIPHPPGNPLFVVTARAWELLLAPTGLSVAVRINLFSAMMSALAHGFWFLVMHRVMAAISDRKMVRLLGAGLAVLVSATAFTVWNQSNVNEKVYTVSLFTIALLTWLAFVWRDRVEGRRNGRKAAARKSSAAAGGGSEGAGAAAGASGAQADAAGRAKAGSTGGRPGNGTGFRGWLERFAWVGSDTEHSIAPGNLLLLGIFILALSVGNHLMAFLVAPACFVLIMLVNPRTLLDWRLYAFGAVLAVLGLSIHLFLPIRAGLHPIINEAAPTCNSMWGALQSIVTFGGKIPFPGEGCADLTAALARQQYDKPSVFLSPLMYPMQEIPRSFELIVAQIGNYLQYFNWQWARSVAGNESLFGGLRPVFTLLFAGLGLFGAWSHYKNDGKSFWYMAVLFLTLSAALVFYLNFKYGFSYTLGPAEGTPASMHEVRERDYFYIVSFSIWGLWAGLGITMLWRRLAAWVESLRSDSEVPVSARIGRAGRRARWLAAPVLALALIPLCANWTWASRSNQYAARDWAYNLLMSVEPYSVLFTNGDNDTFPLWYLQEVEGIRRDVTVIVMSYLNTDWYVRQLRNLTTPCPEGVNPLEDPTRIICQRPYEAEENPDFYDAMLAAPDSLGAGYHPPTRPILTLSNEEIDRILDAYATNIRAFYVREPLQVTAGNLTFEVPSGQVLSPAHTFMLHILQDSMGERPIYYATTTRTYAELGLTDYLIRNGVAYELHNGEVRVDSNPDVYSLDGTRIEPIGGPNINLTRTDKLLWDVFMHRGGIPDEWDHWVDASTQGIPYYYAYTHFAAAAAHLRAGEREEAQRHMERASAWQELGRS